MIHEISPHAFQNQYNPSSQVSSDSYLLIYQRNKVFLLETIQGLELPVYSDISPDIDTSTLKYLFSINGKSCFTAEVAVTLSPKWNFLQDIQIYRSLDPILGWPVIAGYHLWNWYQQNRFCGSCGATTNHKSDERAIQCNHCGTIQFPKISPAIIVAILSGDKILLAKGSQSKTGWYSLIAGYVDIGETIEDAVHREVMEEVGITLNSLRYYKSQPWPLSGSLMIGFVATADDSQPLRIDTKELAHAEWYSRGALPPVSSPLSIAGDMILAFEKGRLT